MKQFYPTVTPIALKFTVATTILISLLFFTIANSAAQIEPVNTPVAEEVFSESIDKSQDSPQIDYVLPFSASRQQCQIELIFVADSSGSIIVSTFTRIKQFIGCLVASIHINTQGIHVIVIPIEGHGSAGGSSATIAPEAGGTVAASDASCPCSRRPGANNSFQCTMGVGETTTQMIGPAGGVIFLQAQQGTSSGVDFRIDIPPNSLLEDVAVRITETSVAPPIDLVDYSPIYLVEPTDMSAHFPMKLTVPYGGNGEIPKTLAIYVADDSIGPFQPIHDSYINAGFLQGSTMHFGAFIAASPRTPEQASCP